MGIAVLLVVVVGLLTADVGQRALAVKRNLEQAQDQLTVLRTAVGQPDQDLPALYAPLPASTAAAVAETDSPVWSDYEHLPDARPSRAPCTPRPVGVVSITLGPESKKTVKAVFRGSASDSTTVEVSHTPKVRPVTVEISQATCR